MATKKKYIGAERRSTKACPFHPELVGKVNTILANQTTYMETTDNLTKIVTNGLKTKVEEIAKTIAEIKLRADTVDTFQWFIDMANKFREKLVVNILKIIFVGGLLSFVWAFMSSGGSKVGEALLKGIFR